MLLLGYFFAFAAGWLFAVSDVLIRGASRGLTPRDNLVLSLIFGVPILAAASAASGEPTLGFDGLLVYSVIGAVHFYAGRLMFYTAVASLGSASAAIIVSPAPLLASMIAALALGEPLTPAKLAGLSMVTLGVYLAAVNPTGKPLGGGSKLLGLAAGAASTLIFASTTVAVRWANLEYGAPLTGATASYIAALSIAALTHRVSTPASGYVVLAAAGGVAVALAQASRYLALSMVPVADAAALISLFPVNTVIAASIAPWTEERIKPRHLVAAALAAAGAALTVKG